MAEEKKLDNKYLFERQKEMLKTFLEKKVITKEQYDYSMKCLETKMKK